MPSKSTQDSFDFLQKYERYVAACGYAKEWASTIAALAQDLQNHSQFLIALDVSERADVQDNLAKAAALSIKVAGSVGPIPVPVVPVNLPV